MPPVLLRLLAEFRASARVRWGAYLLLAMAWGLLLSDWHDQLQVDAIRMAQLHEDIGRLAAFENSKVWSRRAEEAAQLKAALTRGFFSGARSQAQAQWRDMLGNLAAQHKLKVIELTVQATDLTGGPGRPSDEARPAPGPEAAVTRTAGGEPQTLRARMVFEFGPLSTSALLLAIGKHEKTMVVDRLTIRNRAATPAQPPQAEIELRAFLLAGGATQ